MTIDQLQPAIGTAEATTVQPVADELATGQSLTVEPLMAQPLTAQLSPAASRRRLLLSGAALATTAVAGSTLTAGPALGATTYAVRAYPKTTVPTGCSCT